MQAQRLTLVRLQKQEAGLAREPLSNAIVRREGLLNFHFCLYNLEGPYTDGFYHGLLELHENYPFMAPKLIFYTPNGRFDVDMPICTSFTNYHQESWTSAWNVRTLILATISFMYSEEPSYGCRSDTESTRKQYAKSSLMHNKANPKFMELFKAKLTELKILAADKPTNKETSVAQKQFVISSPQSLIKEEEHDNLELGLIQDNIQGKPHQQRPPQRRWRKVFFVMGTTIIVSVIVAYGAYKLI